MPLRPIKIPKTTAFVSCDRWLWKIVGKNLKTVKIRESERIRLSFRTFPLPPHPQGATSTASLTLSCREPRLFNTLCNDNHKHSGGFASTLLQGQILNTKYFILRLCDTFGNSLNRHIMLSQQCPSMLVSHL